MSIHESPDELSNVAALLRQGQWQSAHDAIQRHHSPMAYWMHGILHLQEGDLEDAENWYERAGRNFRARGDNWQQELALWEAELKRCVSARTGKK